MMSTIEYHEKRIEIQDPAQSEPTDLLAIRRYLADGWRICAAERVGHTLLVDLVRPVDHPTEGTT